MARPTLPILGDRIAEAREARGHTRYRLGKLCGFGNHNVGSYEDGMSLPDARSLRRLCEVLEVSADWLLGLTEERERRA